MDNQQDVSKKDTTKQKIIDLVRKYRSQALEAKNKLDQLQGQTQQLTDENSQAVKRVQQCQKLLQKTVACERIKTMLAERGVKRIQQAARLIEPMVDVELPDDGENVSIRINGDSDGDIGGYIDRWLAENPHFIPASRDSGSGLHPGMVTSPVVSVDQLDKNVSRKIDFIARYGPEAFVRLARNRTRK